ncbi:hypothetical protein ABZ023_34205 [Streptomyces sp. NPDC006367]|uniref:hypothetical protein n=1 Tax=unclassified Streptomyces TaxID=2593676 RepID=UPI0033AE91B0
MDSLRALIPEATDVIRVRAAIPHLATNWAWTQAEVLGAYQWPPYPGASRSCPPTAPPTAAPTPA